jgi:hypothetical protein
MAFGGRSENSISDAIPVDSLTTSDTVLADGIMLSDN